MKLVTYESAKQSRLGVVQGDVVVDVAAAYGLIRKGRIADTKMAAAAEVLRKLGRPPQDMIELLGLGERYRKALGVVVASAGAMGKKGPKGLLFPCARPSCARPSRIPTRSPASASTTPTTRARAARNRPRRRFFSSNRTIPFAVPAIPSSCLPTPRKWITKRNSPW